MTGSCQAAERHLSGGCVGAFQSAEWALVKCWWLSGKESTCNVGDLGLIPGLERSRPRHDEDLREPLVRRQGSQVSMRVARGHVRLFATPWTVAHQAPPSMGFPRQEYWSIRCARPSGVPRGPGTSTGSLASQRHPGKFPKVPGRSRGK